MSRPRTRTRANDPARPTIASLCLSVKLVTLEEDAELRGLLERYEQLLLEWEALSHRALKALAARPSVRREVGDGLRRS